MKRGSALLIVLGMLSFMVVSAVAFSIYMRQNRIPSSFLRRQTAAREMVKAALARAIDEIDAAVGNDPFPGVGPRARNSPYDDRWIGRVYCPRDTTRSSQNKTVSVLPFEGLAYVPPAIVNEVRYYGRRTPTAKWQLMDYDAGRYAYVAVNVSDFFDVNRISASLLRNSSGNGRLSTAYLFEDAAHSSSAGSKPESFQTKVVGAVNADSDADTDFLVSTADLALKLNKEASDHFRHPLIEFVKNGGGGGNGLYGAVPGDKASVVAHQMLLTDSWYPMFATNVMNNVGDRILTVLDQQGGQPFIFRNDVPSRSMSAMQLQANSFADAPTPAPNGERTFDLLRGGLNLCSFAALYDYLDPDDIPLSLAMPTVERTPMLNGLQMIAQGVKLQVKWQAHVVVSSDPALQDPNDASKKGKEGTVTAYLNGMGGALTFSGAALYPFKGPAAGDHGAYGGEVMSRIFFVQHDAPEMKVRLGGTGASALAPPANWQNRDSYLFGDGWAQTYASIPSVGVPDSNTSESSATVGIGGTGLTLPNVQNGNSPILQFTYKLDYLGNMVGDPVVVPPTTPLQYFTYDDGAATLTKASAGAGTKLKPCVTFWTKVTNGDGDVVDLVPATMTDDSVYVPGRASFPASVADTVSGQNRPYMLFTLDDAILDISVDGVKAGLGGSLPAAEGDTEGTYDTQPGVYTFNAYAPDPRYNFAPEDWYRPSGNMDPSQWYAQNQAAWQDRDGEIWMFVSDAGYLQSMGELQFLARTGELPDDPKGSANNPIKGNYFNSGKYNGAPFSQRTGWNACANHDYFWKTYNVPRARSDSNYTKDDNLYKWGIASSFSGARVNPFGDNQNAIMAAFANTPMDWYVAATNFGLKTYSADSGKCFNNWNSQGAKIPWQDLWTIAGNITNKFQQAARSKGESELLEWDFLAESGGWDTWPEWDDDNFFGVSLPATIADIDRKFLFSYWRECFGIGQQLFLVFVRAEPSIVGGGEGDGSVPPQLGGKAVALVWRDPYPGKFNENGVQATPTGGGFGANSSGGSVQNMNPPHRVRILFYHQFD